MRARPLLTGLNKDPYCNLYWGTGSKVDVPDLKHSAPAPPTHLRCRIQAISLDKCCLASLALLFQITLLRKVWSDTHQVPPADPCVHAEETAFIEEWKKGFLNGLLSVLESLHKKQRIHINCRCQRQRVRGTVVG